jgi:hypothetical protein
MPSDIRAHARGKWTVETRNATDCHGNQTSTLERFHVHRDPASGAVLCAFNSKFDLIDYATQNHIASAAKVRREMPHLLPPAALAQIARENGRGNGPRLDDGRTDFKGMLGE